jgi:hypothetical protein
MARSTHIRHSRWKRASIPFPVRFRRIYECHIEGLTSRECEAFRFLKLKGHGALGYLMTVFQVHLISG